jgi:GxxExxY protein
MMKNGYVNGRATMTAIPDFNWDELNSITEKIIGSSFEVSNTLGSGFLEKVYENSLVIEIKKTGLSVLQQDPIPVYYDEDLVGDYFADILVENKIIVELKTVKNLDNTHFAQCMNYLRATNLKLCLLINFGNPKVEIKRIAN